MFDAAISDVKKLQDFHRKFHLQKKIRKHFYQNGYCQKKTNVHEIIITSSNAPLSKVFV